MSYTEDRELYIKGKLSVVERAKYFLKKIEENRDLNCFLFVDQESVLQQSQLADDAFRQGSAGRLSGMFVAVKDNINVKDMPLTCGSKMLESYKAIFNATAVERLIKEGAIIIGKTNLDEFAMGSSGETSYFGSTLHPSDKTRVPGGSSSGSAVAVAADLCHLSLGSETGGSVRQPASYCGIHGFKPSYGKISRYGLVAFASSFDCIGIFSKDIECISLALDCCSGQDIKDSSSCSFHDKLPFSEDGCNFKKTKIAIPRQYLDQIANKDIKDQYKKYVNILKQHANKVEEVDIKTLDASLPCYYVLTPAEASANLARYDGVRYGHRAVNPKKLVEMYKSTRTEGFGEEVKRRIMLGNFVLASGFEHEYYKKGQKIRQLIKKEYENILGQYDYIFTPTTPNVAFKLKASLSVIEMWQNDIFTASANLAGLPSINIDCQDVSQNLPYGFQLMGSKGSDEKLLCMAQELSDLLKSK